MRDRFLWIGCAAYAVAFTALGTLKYLVHRNLVDFGIFAQTAASAFGCFCNPIEGSHWAFHFSPILYVAGAVLLLAHSPLTLIALQAIAGALVAPPIYGLLRRHGGSECAARRMALLIWLYPPLAGLIFGDFHENGFAPAAVAWTLYAFDAGAIVWTAIGAAVVLTIKEDQAVFLAIAGALGTWRFWGTPRGRVAAATSVASLAVLAIFFGLIQPHASASAVTSWQPQRFYAWTHADLAALPSMLPARLGFVLLVFVPLLFLPFVSPWMSLAAAPLAEVLLSRQPTAYTLGTHYAGAWIGYVLVAFAFAMTRFEPARMQKMLSICIVFCAIELTVADPLHPGLNLRRIEARDTHLDAVVSSLPRDVDVASQEEAYTHLALRDPNARLLPEEPSRATLACFVLIDDDFPASARLEEYGARLAMLVAQRQYVEVTRSGHIVLYRHASACR
jgi:uncharacterized membrane protein